MKPTARFSMFFLFNPYRVGPLSSSRTMDVTMAIGIQNLRFWCWKDEEMQPAKKVIWFIRTIFVSLYGHCTNRQEKMNTKLTLKLDNDVISRAKKYAQERKTSLSKMIESYLDYVTKPEPDDSDITPLVKSLSGVISLPEDYDYKKDRTEYLVKKYS
jgi:hypothetical protein